MPRKGTKKRLMQRKGVNIRGHSTRNPVPVESHSVPSTVSAPSSPITNLGKDVEKKKPLEPKVHIETDDVYTDSLLSGTDKLYPWQMHTIEAGPSVPLAPRYPLNRKSSSDSEDEPPQIFSVNVMVHNATNTPVEHNSQKSVSHTAVSINTHPNAAINRIPKDVIEIAPTYPLKRKLPSDSEDEPPQIFSVEVMVHNTANTPIEHNFQRNLTNIAVSTDTHPSTITVRPINEDIIEVDVEDSIENISQLSASLVEDIQTEFANVTLNTQRQIANQIDAARANAPTREDIQRDMNRLRNIGNHGDTYLMASERVLRLGASNLGLFNHTCRHCSAFYFQAEITCTGQYTKCCQKGNIALENFPGMPDLLEALFRGFHPLSNLFKKFILQYNYAFQFVSLEANLRNLPRGRAPPVYAIRGKIFHHISNVNVNEPLQRYGPIYFLDPDNAINARNENNHHVLDRRLIHILEQLLRDVNPYARAYMHLRERYNLELQTIERLQTEALQNNVEPAPLQMPTITLELLSVRGRNRRQYDLPRVEEVAAVYNLLPDTPATPNMRIYIREEPTRFENISEESELNDPLVFPLLFPQGEPGWYIGIPHRNGNRNTTLCEYYAYRLGIRDNDLRFKYGGKLTQQFVVAAYIKIENNRLKYILRNQDRLRATEYVGLADYLHRRVQEGNENDETATLGRMVILPSSFIGSPRHQQQLFQDAMAVVGRFGIPSLFITMTTNARWPEILNNIPAGHSANDHPSLLDRVFQCKVNKFVDDMLKYKIFGIPLANLYVIEFQKRGLPHCHNLLILRNEDKLTNPYRIDAFISAEIPDPQAEPELYEIVTSFMVHGPCGELNPDSVCMVNGQCSKKYPKDFNEITVISDNGQVLYKRPNNGRTITVRTNNTNCVLDNRWIVPYNPFLLLKYKCHINTEACATTQCVKYLYKYFFKGVDMALVRVNAENQANYNEVENYVNARYMTPPEACWHINQFAMHKNTHTVYRLCVHLPNRQIVRFQPGFELEAVQNNEITQLTAWFVLNENNPDTRQYLYTDIPYHYVWNNRTKHWTRRQRGANKIVVRMYSVSIRNQELYYLRMLLLHVPGARSYEDLRTINGVICNTFKEACQLRNLLADDVEWTRALREACLRDMPIQLRQMFAFILIFCDVSDAPALWNEFRNYFMEDFKRRGLSDDEALQQTLQCIQTILILNGTRLALYGLPEPAEVIVQFDPINIEAEKIQGQNMYENLNHEQRTICNAVMTAIHDSNEPNRLFLVNAAAGSGKSYLFQTLISQLRGEELPVLVACPTGIAASILKGGRTIHSVFKLPFNINETTTTGVAPTTAEGRFIASVKLLIVDEVSMVTNLIFNIIEKALRDICDDNRPFGNKVVLLGGDFRQTLPVVVGGNRCTIVNACIKSSRHWPLFTNYELNTNVRAIENEEFATWLLNLGSASLQPLRRSMYGNIIQIPSDCYVTSIDDLIEFCFNDVDPIVAINRAILVPTNNISHTINEQILQKLDGTRKIYFSADSVDTTDDPAAEIANYTVEFLNSLTPSGIPPHKLVLKKDAIIMLLRNLNIKKGLCNGTRLIVRVLGKKYIDAEKIDSNGRPTGERVFIPRIDLKTSGDTLPFTLKRRQFPVRLAYTMTIHKSQGQTFQKVGIYLDEPVFTHGQLYVAFSRARHLEDVKVYMLERPEQGQLLQDSENMYTRNVVYREIHQSILKPLLDIT